VGGELQCYEETGGIGVNLGLVVFSSGFGGFVRTSVRI